ncbi:MAG: hypothetical protein RJA10_2997 [Pseudomonadota bacterium]|jgi:hypothetical protein
MNRRTVTAATLAAALALGGCASLNFLSSEVRSFGDWPAGRAPGLFAFERLPSQQAQAGEAEALEKAAQAALLKAGFKAAAAGQEPDVLVQLGGRFGRTARSPWDDPLWWHGGFGPWRRGPWVGPSWQLRMHLEAPRYTYEVALLLRDRASGKPLYETRAASDGNSRADAGTVAALFQAALADFPRPALSPRQVTVALPQ